MKIPEQERPIRALQVFNQYTETGGEEIWVEQMSKLGQELIEFHELRFHSRAWKGPGSPGFCRQALWLGDNPYSRKRLREEVASLKPDVLIFHNLIPVASFGLYDEAARLEIPVIQYIHNFRPFSPSGTLWIRNRIDTRSLHGNIIPEILAGSWERSRLKTALLGLRLFLLRRSENFEGVTLWVAVSEFMRQKFIEAGIPASKVVTLRHCWEIDHEFLPSAEGDHYLFLGRLVPEKGVFTLLDAWEILEAQLGDRCPKLIIGGTGPEASEVHARANKLSKVECVGFVVGNDKKHLIRTCRGLIAPSIWWEPLGLIVYEAYEALRPVIGSKSGGLTETVIPESTGYLHEPGIPQSLAECVLKMEAVGSNRRSQMGSNGHQWLLTNASPNYWLQQFKAILDSVTSDTSD